MISAFVNKANNNKPYIHAYVYMYRNLREMNGERDGCKLTLNDDDNNKKVPAWP